MAKVSQQETVQEGQLCIIYILPPLNQGNAARDIGYVYRKKREMSTILCLKL
jgi:hypothetical protein